ncbi:putative phosphoesterase [Pullulanibacillus pueri]|uniref:DeoR family transcriptional regulator n=1 Tax=Pullulanibacillus pueri TaxID=1437324 RepID=A0A8J2ZS83_9BACL|nr:metallophosphoesterase family protein [Pullulanibacillus pueri]MBM7679936.1 putative phosphoesterase [Pullulanibacillus pueri]GGH73571.1 DeoR family transcriptional regulator [Pullulanibacillus pueri]
MRKVAAIYDIHGNDFALNAVLEEVRNCDVDTIVVGGDLAWGPQPALVMERLMALEGNVLFIKGNADREVAGRYGVEQGLDEGTAEINQWCTDQLTKSQLEFLNNLQEKVTLHIDGLGEVLFVHGSPRSDEEAIRKATPEIEIEPMIHSVEEDIIVCGHTHVQFDRRIKGKRIINAGSVGLQSAARGACWAILGPDVALRETEYNYQLAAEHILKSGVPMARDFADHVLNPPTEGP